MNGASPSKDVYYMIYTSKNFTRLLFAASLLNISLGSLFIIMTSPKIPKKKLPQTVSVKDCRNCLCRA